MRAEIKSTDARTADLEGAVAVVTGGARGIGFGIASALASQGAAVVVTDLDEAAAHRAADCLTADGAPAAARRHDVTDPESSTELARWIVEKYSRIDVLVNNAGISGRVAVAEMEVEEWRRMIEVNLTSIFLVTRAVIPHMIGRRAGRIISVASVLGKSGKPLMAHYTAAKFGVVGFTQALALELAPFTITVNAICPGVVRTRLWESELEEIASREKVTTEDAWSYAVRDIPLGRAQEPADIGGVVAFLASSAGKNITGQALNVDGGAVMH